MNPSPELPNPPDPPRAIQIHPEPPRSIQIHPDAIRTIQIRPDAQHCPKSITLLSKTIYFNQKYKKSFKHPEKSRQIPEKIKKKTFNNPEKPRIS